MRRRGKEERSPQVVERVVVCRKNVGEGEENLVFLCTTAQK